MTGGTAEMTGGTAEMTGGTHSLTPLSPLRCHGLVGINHFVGPVADHPSNMLAYLRDRIARTIARAATVYCPTVHLPPLPSEIYQHVCCWEGTEKPQCIEGQTGGSWTRGEDRSFPLLSPGSRRR